MRRHLVKPMDRGGGCLVFFVVLELLVAAASAQQVTLAWDPNQETDLAGYNVFRSDAGAGFVRLTESLEPSTGYQDTSIVFAVDYSYVVTAVNTSGLESGFSNQVDVNIANPDAPANPSGLVITSQGANAIIQWDAVPGAESYLVDYAKTGAARRTAETIRTQYRVKLKKNQAVMAMVSAVRQGAVSEPSGPVYHKRPGNPPRPRRDRGGRSDNGRSE